MRALPVTTLEAIEHLDFRAELACEHSSHERGEWSHHGPAHYLIRRFPHCDVGQPNLLLMCASGYERNAFVRCTGCGLIRPRDEAWLVLEVLR